MDHGYAEMSNYEISEYLNVFTNVAISWTCSYMNPHYKALGPMLPLALGSETFIDTPLSDS